jgi:predicted esterase
VSLSLEQDVPGPHARARILTAGSRPDQSRAAVLFCHGRGAAAEDMLGFASEIETSGIAWIAPQANEHTWYPASFMAPLRANEPYLSSALALLAAIVRTLEQEGIPAERQMLMGFSQGGCLTLEYSGRNARRYGAVVGLSAGLLGPLGRSWSFEGSLDGTPVFLGCSDRDPHIPRDRVEQSASELKRIGGRVELQIYPDLAHTVNRDELDHVRNLLERIP